MRPEEEFAKLVGVIGELRQDVAAALDRAAPDYSRDIAGVLTTMRAIEKKPALSASAGALDAAAREGAEKGTSEAVTALRSARQALEEARATQTGLLADIEGLSWKVKAGACVILLAFGVATGFTVTMRTVKAPFPLAPSTAKECATVGGTLAKDAAGRPVCVFSVTQ